MWVQLPTMLLTKSGITSPVELKTITAIQKVLKHADNLSKAYRCFFYLSE